MACRPRGFKFLRIHDVEKHDEAVPESHGYDKVKRWLDDTAVCQGKEKSIKAIREKRKRYRNRKKKKIWELKHSITSGPSNDDSQEAPQVSEDHASLTTDTNSIFSQFTSLDLPIEACKKDGLQEFELKKQFSAYEKQAIAYFEGLEKILLPISISRADKEYILSRITDLQRAKKQAQLEAQMLGRKCDKLEQYCQELQRQKESVRHFWRDKVLGGQTRGGRILMKSLAT